MCMSKCATFERLLSSYGNMMLDMLSLTTFPKGSQEAHFDDNFSSNESPLKYSPSSTLSDRPCIGIGIVFYFRHALFYRF